MIYFILLLVSTQVYGSIRVSRGSYFRPSSYSQPLPSYPSYPSSTYSAPQTYNPSSNLPYEPRSRPNGIPQSPTPTFVPSFSRSETGPLPPVIPNFPQSPSPSGHGPPAFK